MMRVILHAMTLKMSAMLVLTTMTAPLEARTPYGDLLPTKKLLEYGWDVPFPDQVLAEVRQMETRPFDGVVFRLREYNHAFDTHPWPRADLEPQLAQLEAIEWRRFTDNFLTLYAANNEGMDWFDDDHWRAIEANLRLTAEAARRGGCVGIVFDPEPYGPNPWLMSEAAPDRGFAETAAQVRRRGAQFIGALQAEMPDVRVLSLYQLSVVAGVFAIDDPARVAAQLATHHYGLLPAFIDGMLDAIGPAALLVDGNEPAYYYEDEAPFLQAYHALSQQAQRLISPANRPAYRSQSQVGMAVYVDQVLGLRQPPQGYIAHYLTLEERLAFLEHNVYWSLAVADEYTWVYSERMDWWAGEFPDGADLAVARGRLKAQAHQPLGFELDSLTTRARQRMEDTLAARVELRSAAIARRPAKIPRPVVDGRLDEPAWTSATPMASFQPPAARGDRELQARTTARVLWDDGAVYVAIDCAEPEPDRIVRAGLRRDDSIWAGDDVEVIIGDGASDGTRYTHFIVNPDNLQWDGHSSPQGDDSSWNAEWDSAVAETATGWTAELRLPWAALEGDPRTPRRVNLCRARAGNDELSCWSGVLRLFLETERFGRWSFTQ